MEFPAFGAIPRLHRDITITEKIDGTNGLMFVYEPSEDTENVPSIGRMSIPGTDEFPGGHYLVAAGSRSRWITPEQDNHGFARWVAENAENLVVDLGPGTHYGEWWGSGIQRGYGLPKGEKRFSLFNSYRWAPVAADFITPGLDVVPVLAFGEGRNLNSLVETTLDTLREDGSVAAPGFMRPEGVIIYHRALNGYFKVTMVNDDRPKQFEGHKPGDRF